MNIKETDYRKLTNQKSYFPRGYFPLWEKKLMS